MQITASDAGIRHSLYRWDREESHRERFTCRSVPGLLGWDASRE